MSRHRARPANPPTLARTGPSMSSRTRIVRRSQVIVTAMAVVGGMFWLAYLTAPSAHAPAPAVVAVRDTVTGQTEAERIYLDELRYAGIELTPDEEAVAIEIARRHVEHGHLIGMREWIMEDWRVGVPRLTEEQVDIARVVVEHHFLRVTGRKQ